MRSIKAIGAILAFVGIFLIGFFNAGTQITGLYVMPFSNELSSIVDPNTNWLIAILGVPKQTVQWWSDKITGMILGLIGLLMLRYG